MISKRVTRLVAKSSPIAAAHFRVEAEPYHPKWRPNGYLNLGTAENRLVWDLLAPRLAKRRPLTAADTHYTPLHGMPTFREAIAHFLSRVCRTPINAEDLVVVSGATAALDIIASALCDPGEAIAVPAPYYGAFDIDLTGHSEARLIPVPLSSSRLFHLTPETIDRVLTQTRRDGIAVRAVALTSPSNPVGCVYPAQTLQEIIQVAAQHDVDIITDEIYANSVFGPVPFISLLDEEINSTRPEHTHMVWGFAKDFALSGFKVGVLYTPDQDIRAAARVLAYFAPTSTDTQVLLRDILADTDWVDYFLAESQRRLALSYARSTQLLDEFSIPYIPATAGFFVWTDLRAWLPTPTFAAERALWGRIFEIMRVNILPGEVFACPEPGWFRICHTTDPALVREGITRLGRLLHS